MNNNRFYVTDMAPNGTRDLIITNEDSQIIGVISEAVFGGRVTHNYATAIVADDDSVWACQREARNGRVGIALDSFIEGTEVFAVDYDWVMRHIAVNPMSDGTEIIELINKSL